MNTNSAWQSNRLAIIGLLLGGLIFSVSYLPMVLLGLLNSRIWQFYFENFILSHDHQIGKYIPLALIVSLAGLILGIVSLKREKQKRWMAIVAILLGIYGILAQCFAAILAFGVALY